MNEIYFSKKSNEDFTIRYPNGKAFHWHIDKDDLDKKGRKILFELLELLINKINENLS